MPLTYWDYLKLADLLSLQSGADGDETALTNDEVMFIVIHQIDELWFKLMVRELVAVRDLFAQNPVPEQALASGVRGLRRLTILLRQTAGHFELMETMTTRDYLAFRDKLSPASGFQSAQMREIEILLGLDDRARIAFGHEGSYREALKNPDGSESIWYRRVQTRLQDRPSLLEALEAWLFRTPIQGSRPGDPNDHEVVAAFVEEYLAAHARETKLAQSGSMTDATTEADRSRLAGRFEREVSSARAFLFAEDVDGPRRSEIARVRAALVFIESYRELALLAWPREVLDAVVQLEQASVIFRQRHARMVERIIGRRTGTGGSAGVDYLDQTALAYRVFKDLWAVRTLLIRRDALPALRGGDVYGFAVADDGLRS